MGLQKILGLVVLIVGIILLVFGINSTQSLNEKVVSEVKGRYSNETIWYIIGGAALIIIGGAGFFRRVK